MKRTLAYAVDVDTGKCLGADGLYPLAEVPVAWRGDTIALELTFKQLTSISPRTYGSYALPTTGTWICGIKRHLGYNDTSYLASTETVTVASAKLSFDLALTSSDWADLLAGNTQKVECVLEISHLADGVEGTLASIRLDILNDYIKRTEGSPAPASPTYYTAAEVRALLASMISVPDGMRLRVDEDGNIFVEEIEEPPA